MDESGHWGGLLHCPVKKKVLALECIPYIYLFSNTDFSGPHHRLPWESGRLIIPALPGPFYALYMEGQYLVLYIYTELPVVTCRVCFCISFLLLGWRVYTAGDFLDLLLIPDYGDYSVGGSLYIFPLIDGKLRPLYKNEKIALEKTGPIRQNMLCLMWFKHSAL